MRSLAVHSAQRSHRPGNSRPDRDAEIWLLIARGTALTVLGSVTALFLAALSTVILVFALRRATLRQINSNLVQIAEDLKSLRGGAPRGSANRD